MKEYPIAFSDPMVRAILAGHKSQTRRVCDLGYLAHDGVEFVRLDEKGRAIFRGLTSGDLHTSPNRFGVPGEGLWVKETYSWVTLAENEYYGEFGQKRHPDGYPVQMIYRADDDNPFSPVPYRSARFMPRWASRINLLNKAIRVERVQNISEADAFAEGLVNVPDTGKSEWGEPAEVIYAYMALWNGLHMNDGHEWESNPWVRVIEFRNRD